MIRHKLVLAAALAAATLSLACQAAPRTRPVEAGPVDGTLKAARGFLEGDWALDSFVVYPPGQPPVTLKGSGTLSYDEYGNLTVDLRPDSESAILLRQAGIDVPDSGRIATQGRTAVDLQNRTLTYVLEGKSPGSGPLALSRIRHWQVDGDILTVTTKDDAGKPVSVGRWRKRAASDHLR